MKAILVPIDFSVVSDHALKFAVMLARNIKDSKIVLLNIIIPVHTNSFAASADVSKLQGATADRFNVELMHKNEDLVKKKAENYRGEFEHIESFVRFGESKTDLNDFVEEFQADLVITGSEDLDAFDTFLFGRKEEKIIRKTDIPVITVKKEPKEKALRSIVLAVDIEEKDLEWIRPVKALAESVGAMVHMVYVITGDQESDNGGINRLDSIAHDYGMKRYTVNTVSNSDVEEGIRNFARKKEAGLIAVMTEGKGKLHRLIFGSTAHDLVRSADFPVLVSNLQGE